MIMVMLDNFYGHFAKYVGKMMLHPILDVKVGL